MTYWKVTKYTGVARIPGSMPSVFGAPETGDKIVTFETVTFVQS